MGESDLLLYARVYHHWKTFNCLSSAAIQVERFFKKEPKYLLPKKVNYSTNHSTNFIFNIIFLANGYETQGSETSGDKKTTIVIVVFTLLVSIIVAIIAFVHKRGKQCKWLKKQIACKGSCSPTTCQEF